jgi:hypothetical protein
MTCPNWASSRSQDDHRGPGGACLAQQHRTMEEWTMEEEKLTPDQEGSLLVSYSIVLVSSYA